MKRRVRDQAFRELFAAGRPVKITQIRSRLAVSRATATRLMARQDTYTSVNGGGLHCVLPSMCGFDESGFCRIGGLLFFRDGNQRDAICHHVNESEAGLRAAELNEFFGVSITMQLLWLTREGRLRREKQEGSFVYFCADQARYAQQHESRQRTEADESARLTVTDMLIREDKASLELLVKVLLTCLAHPQFSAKSVALSLARKGESVCTAWVREKFEQFEIVKKTPDSDPGKCRSHRKK